jgi:tetratricopeptide (TPR) repeat protein
MKILKTLLAAVLCLSLTGCVAMHNFLNPKYGGQLAMYGNRPHAEMEALQKSWIEQMTKKYGSREKASSVAAGEGWDYLSLDKGNPSDASIDLAMRSFNGAWILSETNYEAFWGFGICTARGQYNFDDAEKYFNKAMELSPNNARLLMDVGFTYTVAGSNGNVQRLDRAIELYRQAVSIQPDFEMAYYNWAITLFYKGDYAGSWDKIKKAEQCGGKSIQQGFVQALSRKMPRPK